jgi:hypothetical protein
MAILAAGHLLDGCCRSAFGTRRPRRRQNAGQNEQGDKGATPSHPWHSESLSRVCQILRFSPARIPLRRNRATRLRFHSGPGAVAPRERGDRVRQGSTFQPVFLPRELPLPAVHVCSARSHLADPPDRSRSRTRTSTRPSTSRYSEAFAARGCSCDVGKRVLVEVDGRLPHELDFEFSAAVSGPCDANHGGDC